MAAGNLIRIAQAYVELSVKGSKKAEAQLTAFQATFTATSRSMLSAAKAFATLGAAAAAVFAPAIKNASDLVEATNKVNEVFKDGARDIFQWAETSSDAFGLSKRAALEYVSELGLILEKTGLAAEATSEMSRELVKLAADGASFYNVSLDESFEKIKSALVGEAKPIRTFGVLLSEAAVSARAAELGFQKVNGEYSEGSKVAARYLIVTEQMAQATGDFERTSGDLANQTRIFKADLENLGAAIGTAVLPRVNELLTDIIAITKAMKDFAEVNPTLIQLGFDIGVIGSIMAVLLYVGSKVVQVLTTGWTKIAAVWGVAATGILWLKDILYLFIAGSTAATAWALALGAAVAGIAIWFGDMINGGRKWRAERAKGEKEAQELEKKRLVLMERVNKIEAERDEKAKAAKIAKEADAAAAAKALEEEEKRAEAALKYYDAEIVKLKERFVLLTQGEEAAARFRDKEAGADGGQVNDLSRIRQALQGIEDQKSAQEKIREEAEAYTDSLNEQLKTLELQKIELQQGEFAAARAADIANGRLPADVNRLDILRRANAAIAEGNQLRDEALALAQAEQEAAIEKEKATRQSAADAREELRLQILGLKLGEEAEIQAREKAKGFTDREIAENARLRRIRNELQDAQNAAKSAQKGLRTSNDTAAFGGGGAFNKALFGQRFGVVGGDDPAARATYEANRRILVRMAQIQRYRKKQDDYANRGRQAQLQLQRQFMKKIGGK